jgi:DNA topoisomerase IA
MIFAAVNTIAAPRRIRRRSFQHLHLQRAQDAHEAIRPTYLDLPPEAVAGSVTADD